jgi:hypothetical protein
MDVEACMALLTHCVDPLMEKVLKTATDELESLFRDRRRHAITYNHYFTENVQKIFNDRYERRILEVLKKMFPLNYNETQRTGPTDLSAVWSKVSTTIPDMDTCASIELLDHLEAFYKVRKLKYAKDPANPFVGGDENFCGQHSHPGYRGIDH